MKEMAGVETRDHRAASSLVLPCGKDVCFSESGGLRADKWSLAVFVDPHPEAAVSCWEGGSGLMVRSNGSRSSMKSYREDKAHQAFSYVSMKEVSARASYPEKQDPLRKNSS